MWIQKTRKPLQNKNTQHHESSTTLGTITVIPKIADNTIELTTWRLIDVKTKGTAMEQTKLSNMIAHILFYIVELHSSKCKTHQWEHCYGEVPWSNNLTQSQNIDPIMWFLHYEQNNGPTT